MTDPEALNQPIPIRPTDPHRPAYHFLPEANWLNDPTWVYLGLVILGLWGIGGAVIINLAGLQGIPTELYDAAKVDGAPHDEISIEDRVSRDLALYPRRDVEGVARRQVAHEDALASSS